MTFSAFPRKEIGVGKIERKIRRTERGGEKKHLWIHHFAYIGVKVGGKGGASHGHSHLVDGENLNPFLKFRRHWQTEVLIVYLPLRSQLDQNSQTAAEMQVSRPWIERGGNFSEQDRLD